MKKRQPIPLETRRAARTPTLKAGDSAVRDNAFWEKSDAKSARQTQTHHSPWRPAAPGNDRPPSALDSRTPRASCSSAALAATRQLHSGTGRLPQPKKHPSWVPAAHPRSLRSGHRSTKARLPMPTCLSPAPGPTAAAPGWQEVRTPVQVRRVFPSRLTSSATSQCPSKQHLMYQRTMATPLWRPVRRGLAAGRRMLMRQMTST